ncbi:hypothetical protein HS088_TW03G01287 [Tripterygium wilfordii]|uniref:Uncharacterized protein n=1 Tax=Tripterygium wilfordii TaxID=458696 RepID=A0A7J7DXA0_TRIWF|nr:hypothetical protein HS088_TW03G01287 [Tripterygium wilfordii]
MKRNRSPTSNPLASIDGIQKHLIRPSSLLSSQPSSAALYSENLEAHESWRLKVNSTEFERKQEITRRKVEDYLDPVLLSAIYAKLGRVKKDETMKAKLKRNVKDFEWPVDELKAFKEEHSRSETRSNLRTNRSVDISHDVDLMEGEMKL